MKWAKKQTGFTIVELLIVVVVIAILAAITIVAYSGIRNRAVNSAAQSAASSTGKKVQTYATLHGELYPTESSYKSELNLPDSTTSASYDYFTTTDQKSFCISVTNSATQPETAYAYTNTSGGAVPGRCAKNLVANPSFETLTGSTINGISASSRVTVETSSTGVISGARSAAVTPTYSAGTDTFADMSNWGIQANTTYNVGLQVTLTQPLLNSNARFRFNVGSVDQQSSGPTTVGTHQISWLYNVVTPTPVSFLRFMPGGKLGDPTVYIDNFMVTATPNAYRYGDGDSPGWTWMGSPHASASFGPALQQ